MENELINLEALKKMFSQSTGVKTIEVTFEEYLKLLKEAQKEDIEIEEEDSSFTLNLEGSKINVICEYDNEDILQGLKLSLTGQEHVDLYS